GGSRSVGSRTMADPAPPSLQGLVWLDGEVVESHRARVSPLDHGFTVGDGVFETMKVIDGTPFALARHLARLARSAAVLEIPAPDEAALRLAARELLDATGARDARLRITITAGIGPPGSARGEARP